MTEYSPISGGTIAEINDYLDSWLSLTPKERLDKLEEMKYLYWNCSSREAKDVLLEQRGTSLSELEKRITDYKKYGV